ncbi:MAG: metallophosphoesterase, partial [Chloroflexi bacterium]
MGRNPRHVRRGAARGDVANRVRPHLSAPVREAGVKIAVFSDIHANWQGLEAVMEDCPPVDETLCLGDVVGYGGDPKRCV